MKAAEEKLEASRVWLVRNKERRSLHNTEVPGKAGSANGEATICYPEDAAKTEGGCT
jgi:hypothetical protein